MKLYFLSLNTIFSKKTIFICATIMLVLPLLLPQLTPWEEKPSLLQPARAQTAWSLLWVCGFVWLLLQGASLGNQHSNNGILQYFKTTGMNRFQQLLQISLGCLTCFGILAVIALGISLFAAMPSNGYEAKHWVILNFQYLFLFGIVTIPLLMLAVSLGTRLNPIVAYLIPFGIGAYGLAGMGYLKFVLADSQNPFIDLIYAVSPHYHLADLTQRLVFKMGALSTASFMNISFYLGGIALVLSTIAFATFKENK